jgi:hypothetical protein
MMSVYSALDGTALRQCKEFNSDYSWVMFYSTISSAMGPLLASVLIKDAAEGSTGMVTPSLGYYCFAKSSAG